MAKGVVNLSDIATHVGVSKSTVSRVLMLMLRRRKRY